MPQFTPPRRPRFGLRSLFVLIVIVSIPCAWVGYALNWIRERRAYLHQHDRSFVRLPYDTPQAPWTLRVFGERGVMTIDLPEGATLDDYHEVADLFPELFYLIGVVPVGDRWQYLEALKSRPRPPSTQQ